MEQQIVDVTDAQDNNRNITIRALRKRTLDIISTLLNPIKVIPNERGLPRDWQGLAELCGISGEKIPSLQQHSDPSNKILVLWSEKEKTESTIDTFILYLEELDRFDIIEDINSLIDEDISVFKTNGIKKPPPDLDADKYILTVDDVSRISEGLEPQTYDAFVLFAEDDIDFATELIETLEKQFNLKCCAKERDLVGGGFEHQSVINLISERCSRLIVIVSPAFLDSSANKFFYSFAQAIGIEQRQRKIIPCLYKPCENLPPEFACYFMLDYNRSGKLWNFWDKLYNSLRTTQSKPLPTRRVTLRSSSKQCLLKSHENVVKFNSMLDLNSADNEKIIPDENMTSCNSANSLDTYSGKIKNNKSFYNRLKRMIKPKSTKNGEVKVEMNDIEVEKDKKRHFFSKSSKRKVALAN